ncbi:ATP-binding cassette domain-containing protein, partial [Clostridium saudiense]|nr:ATP-binding cassette domain-containing protein [Clostridium saudiense]
LIPWKNVFENLSIVIKNEYNKEMVDNKIEEILNILDINDAKYLYPNELSGGMKQKVNIARALLYDFDVLLLDEPFRSLDVKIKNVVINLIRTINYKKNSTVILVSHDKEEVKALADSIFLLSGSPINIVKN